MERYAHILIGLLTLVGILAVLVIRPNSPRLKRWVSEHKSQVEAVAPFVFLIWGGTIWGLMIFKGDYSNVIAMVMATLIICTAVFFFFKRF